MEEEFSSTYPRPIGDIDLEAKAKELGISYFIASFNTFLRDCRVIVVHATTARHFQQYGCDVVPSVDFNVSLDAAKVQAVPVAKTMIQLPWDPKYAWIACELYQDGKPFDQCPRQALKKVLKSLNDRGLEMRTAVEFEFMLFKKDSHEGLLDENPNSNIYGRKQILANTEFIDKVCSCLHDLGWNPERFEKEFLANQYEVILKYTNALDMADRHFFFKFLVKSLAEKEGFRAIFMPMPTEGMIGNGLHLNFSIWESKTGENVTEGDANTQLRISKLAENGLAGIMANLGGLCCFACPTVNSYKRLHAFPNFLRFFAYAREAKWPAIRVVESGDRMEYRLPDGAVNPYLLQASVFAAIIEGIEKKLELDPKQLFDKKIELDSPPVTDYEIAPETLEEACKMLRENKVLRRHLGDQMIDGFVKMKENEIKEYRKHITQWETATADDY